MRDDPFAFALEMASNDGTQDALLPPALVRLSLLPAEIGQGCIGKERPAPNLPA